MFESAFFMILMFALGYMLCRMLLRRAPLVWAFTPCCLANPGVVGYSPKAKRVECAACGSVWEPINL